MMQPTFPTLPSNLANVQGLLAKPNGGLGVDASAMVWPVVSYHKGVIYPFGSGTYYPYHVAATTNYLDSDPTYALRYAWPLQQRYVTLLEVQINEEVGVDEEFEVQLFGCVYTSGLISAATITALDGSAATKLVFNAGDTSTKRVTTFLAATIGGTPITHVIPGVTILGGTYYPGQITIFIHSAP